MKLLCDRERALACGSLAKIVRTPSLINTMSDVRYLFLVKNKNRFELDECSLASVYGWLDLKKMKTYDHVLSWLSESSKLKCREKRSIEYHDLLMSLNFEEIELASLPSSLRTVLVSSLIRENRILSVWRSKVR